MRSAELGDGTVQHIQVVEEINGCSGEYGDALQMDVDDPHHEQRATRSYLHLREAGQPTSDFQNPEFHLKIAITIPSVCFTKVASAYLRS